MPLLVLLTGGLGVRSGVFAEDQDVARSHTLNLPIHCDRDKLASATTNATLMIAAALQYGMLGPN
jgi:hypothetical protein